MDMDMDVDADADPRDERHHGVPDQDAEPTMTAPDVIEVPVVDPPVMDGAEELGGSIVQPAQNVPGTSFGVFADAQGHKVGVAANG